MVDHRFMKADANELQYEMLCPLELSVEMQNELIEHCGVRNISFFYRFDIKSIELLRSLGQDRFKIPSREITNLLKLRHIRILGNSLH